MLTKQVIIYSSTSIILYEVLEAVNWSNSRVILLIPLYEIKLSHLQLSYCLAVHM